MNANPCADEITYSITARMDSLLLKCVLIFSVGHILLSHISLILSLNINYDQLFASCNGFELMGEMHISPQNYSFVAGCMHREFASAFDDTSELSWLRDINGLNFEIKSIAVTGAFAERNIPAQKMIFDLKCNDCDQLYLTLVSNKSIIDPFSRITDSFTESFDSQCRVQNATLKMFFRFIDDREFVVFNVQQNSDRVFLSKSILYGNDPHDDIICGSPCSQTPCKNTCKVRAINTFGMKIREYNHGRECSVQVLNYADVFMGSPRVQYIVNIYYLINLFKRLRILGHKISLNRTNNF